MQGQVYTDYYNAGLCLLVEACFVESFLVVALAVKSSYVCRNEHSARQRPAQPAPYQLVSHLNKISPVQAARMMRQ
jgi:hypothetical protein